MENSPRNQLRCCNIPPNHRTTCSSISQQCYHPRAGHHSYRISVIAGLHIAKGQNLSNQHCWVYQAFNNRPSQHSLKTNRCLHAAKQSLHSPVKKAKTTRDNPTQNMSTAQATRQLRVFLGPSVAKTTQQQHPKPGYFSNPASQ